jgi:hypothetical protein
MFKHLGWKLLIAKLTLASVACSASAQGQFSPISFDELQPVFERTLQLQRDVMSTGKGILVGRQSQTGLTNSLCFLSLSTSLAHLTADLWRLQTLIRLAEQMHDPDDARIVLLQIKDGSVNLQARLEADRPSVNQTPNNCETNAFVATKAQELLNLYTSTTSTLRKIVGRI